MPCRGAAASPRNETTSNGRRQPAAPVQSPPMSRRRRMLIAAGLLVSGVALLLVPLLVIRVDTAGRLTSDPAHVSHHQVALGPRAGKDGALPGPRGAGGREGCVGCRRDPPVPTLPGRA